MEPLQGKFPAIRQRHSKYFRDLTLLVFLAAAGLCQAQDRPWSWTTTNKAWPTAADSVQSVPVRRTQLATGTAIKMRLETAISGKRAKPNRTFSANVTEPVLLDGETIIPAGATVSGRVARVVNPRRIQGRPSVDLRPDKIILPDGRTLSMSAVVVDTGNPNRFDVDEEGRIKTPSRNTHDNRETLIGTGAGAGVGAILGGVPGAVIGATAGAGATTAHRLLRHRYAELPAGTVLIVELRRPLLCEQAPAPELGREYGAPPNEQITGTEPWGTGTQWTSQPRNRY